MNKNTKYARKRGFSSMKDMEGKTSNTIFSGSSCDTSWDNKNSKKNSRKNYSKRPISELAE